MKQFNNQNVTSTKQFKSALAQVFGGIAQRNKQLQQLLLISVNEASRESGGQVVNNLTWLSDIIIMADATKGVNAKRITRYICTVLCNDTVRFNQEKQQLIKRSKDTALAYTPNPSEAWYEFEAKKDKSSKAYDYERATVSAIKSLLATDKGGKGVPELMQAMMKAVAESDGVTITDVITAISDYDLSIAA